MRSNLVGPFGKDACFEVVRLVLSSFKRQQDADTSDVDGSAVAATEDVVPERLNAHVRKPSLARFRPLRSSRNPLWLAGDAHRMTQQPDAALSWGDQPGHTNLFYGMMAVTDFSTSLCYSTLALFMT